MMNLITLMLLVRLLSWLRRLVLQKLAHQDVNRSDCHLQRAFAGNHANNLVASFLLGADRGRAVVVVCYANCCNLVCHVLDELLTYDTLLRVCVHRRGAAQHIDDDQPVAVHVQQALHNVSGMPEKPAVVQKQQVQVNKHFYESLNLAAGRL